MLCRPHSALGCPAQLRLAGSGLAARACLYVHDRVSGWAPRKICTFRRIFSCLPGFLEKCCGLTPPFDDLAWHAKTAGRAAPFGRGVRARPLGWRENKRTCTIVFQLFTHNLQGTHQIKKAPQRERGARGHSGSGVVGKRKKVKSPQKLIIPPPRRQGK